MGCCRVVEKMHWDDIIRLDSFWHMGLFFILKGRAAGKTRHFDFNDRQGFETRLLMTEMESKSSSVECEICCGLELQQDYKPCPLTVGSLVSPGKAAAFKLIMNLLIKAPNTQDLLLAKWICIN